MTSVVVVSRMRAHPDRAAEAERALRALIAPTHEEDGAQIYALHRGVDDPALFFFIEHYRSREQFDAHLSADHVVMFASLSDGLFVDGPEFDVLEGIPDGDPRKGVLC
jgi:quinol monooxygenase YgiN